MFNGTAESLIARISDVIITPIIFLLFALALVYFLYGVMIFIANADQPEMRKTGAKHMIWGVIGMFVMFGVKGILLLIISSFGLQNPGI
jgi:succinate dehydrogenase/fumarate reductase cytochrome b subunit